MRFLKHRHPARMLVVGGITAMLGVLLFASSASASTFNPKGEFAQFGECPLGNPSVTECVFSVTNGGLFTVGKKTVPLKNAVDPAGRGL